MATKNRTTPLQLDAAEAERRVLVTTEDEDRFSLTCAQAIEACKIHTSKKVWFEELRSLFSQVNEWAIENKASVRACYAQPRAGLVAVFIVPVKGAFDFELARKIADLDLDLSQEFPLVPAEVLQIPSSEDGLRTFVDSDTAKRLYGEAG